MSQSVKLAPKENVEAREEVGNSWAKEGEEREGKGDLFQDGHLFLKDFENGLSW